MRRIFFLAILATVYSVSFAQTPSSKDLYLTKSFSDADFKKIDAETTHGDIAVSVVPTADTRIEVYVRSSNSNEELSKEEIKKRLDEYYTLDVSLAADVVRAVAHRKMDFTNGKSSLRISFRIYATKSKSSVLKTDHGNIELSGMAGSQKLTTDHGDISAEFTIGKLIAVTDHGNIRVKESNDDIDIRTDHGDLVLNDVKGKIHAVTDHGNIDGHMIEGTLYASTDHGDLNFGNLTCSVETSTDHGNITLSFEKISGDITANNSNGDISVKLPKGNGIDLDLRARDVDVVTLENFSGTRKKDEIKGTMNGGGAKVNAKTDKGQISLTFR
jgi:Putative adhesin